jgi:hypothetical protein
MIIDLRNMPTLYINLNKDRMKNQSMRKLIKSFGFTNAKRFVGHYAPNHPIVGCATSHYNILSTNAGPLIILEDDCVLYHNTPFIDVPDDADAVYLGLSSWCLDEENWCGIEWKHSFETTNYPRVFKVKNMLATHAILYISDRYIQHCADVAKNCSEQELHVDCGFANIQSGYNVYAVADPIFYQSSNAAFTKISFDSIVTNRKLFV